MNVMLANRMCNFAIEVDIEHSKGLNTLCRASWLLDHDMIEVIYNVIYWFLIKLLCLFL